MLLGQMMVIAWDVCNHEYILKGAGSEFHSLYD